MENENILLSKLDRFIRKYYTNSIIRGVLWSSGVAGASFLVVVILEHLFRFSPMMRMIFFYLFLGIMAFTMARWIFWPAARMFRLGRRISYEQAAEIIGNHFIEINDKLLNALQLIDRKLRQTGDVTLLLASIDQRIRKLKVFPFQRVIRYSRNLRYLKLTLPPIALIVVALIIWPAFITEPARRLVDYSTGYEIPSPFEITILNKKLEVYQREDFELQVQVTGSEIPAELNLLTDGYRYRMTREEVNRFGFIFKSMQRESRFRIVAGDYTSQEFLIRVIPRPTVFSFTVTLTYPPYTRRQQEVMENTGDIVAPEGTVINWRWYTKDVENLHVRFPDQQVTLVPDSEGTVTCQYSCSETGTYSVWPENRFSRSSDSIRYRIICIEDSYPSIVTDERRDSLSPSRLFFTGSVRDDYGFSRLEFHLLSGEKPDSVNGRDSVILLPVKQEVREDIFYHSVDIGQFIRMPGENLIYYFEIWDNDGIRGPKSAKSEIREVRTLTLDEIRASTGESERVIKQELSDSRNDAGKVEKGIDLLERKMLEKQNLDWQEKRDIEELIRRNEEILQSIERIRQENQKAIQSGEEFLKTSESILEKQRRLQELMDELLTEEMKRTLQELRDLLDNLDKEKIRKAVDELKMTARELARQLDRNLELFKQIEFERKLEENIAKLKETALDQDKLAEQVEQQREITESERIEQNKLGRRYDSIQAELQRLQQMEKSLENPVGLEKTAGKQDSIRESMKEASERMQQGDAQKTTQKQRKAGNQMRELAEELEQMQFDSEMDQNTEDAHQIRQLLEHLLLVSFDQEALLGKTRMISRNDPGFQGIITGQKQLIDNLAPVRDSLAAIGKRQFMIQPVISRELNAVERNVEETVQSLTERNIAKALTGQQFSMTSLNNLAILLEEALEQMNRNMNMSLMGKSSKMCQNPSMGKGRKSMKEIRQMQQQLSEQLERIMKGLQEEMEKQGQKGKAGEQGLNEKIARLAAEQEAIREELQRFQQFMKESGEMDQGTLNDAIQGMEQNERDLIHRQVTREALLRQQKIVTRLLESEKAEQLREQQEKRESEEAKNQKRSNPAENLEYNKYSIGGADILPYRSIPVNRFYKGKATMYMIQIQK